MIKRISLATSLIVLMGLQGCGGGGSTTSTSATTTTQSNVTTLATTTGDSKTEPSTPTSDVVEPKEDLVTSTKVVYALKQKTEVFTEYNATTTYSYEGNYTASSHTSRTDGIMIDKAYSYNPVSHVLDIKVKNMIDAMELATRVTFEEGMSNKFVTLGDANHVYLYNTYAPVTYHDNTRIKEEITDIEKELFNVKKYSYTAGKLSTLTVGYQESLTGTFTQERKHAYSYNGGLKIDGKAVNFNHTFNYSDDKKTVTEMADGKVLRTYVFDVVGG